MSYSTPSLYDFMSAAQIADAQAYTFSIDQSLAIQTAIDSLPSRGGKLIAPPGGYRVEKTLQIGNGAVGSPSSINGIRIAGEGAAWGITSFGPPGREAPVVFKLFGTAHAGSIVQINGPMVGAGLSDISFQFDQSVSAGPMARGIVDNGCSYGLFENISVIAPKDFGVIEATVKGPEGGQRNVWRNLFVHLDGVISLPTATGILVGADTSLGSADRAFDSFENVNIVPTQPQQIGIQLQYVDSEKFYNLSINPIPPGGATAILFNYLAEAPYPNGCVFFGLDVYNNFVRNAGTPPTHPNYMNRMYGFSQDNGAPVPNLQNLSTFNS